MRLIQGGKKEEPGDKKGHPSTPNTKPWEDRWGNPLPTKEITKLSKSWNGTQWEEYLQSLEGNLKEKLGVKLDERTKVDMFASRGDEEFQKNAEQDLAEAHAMEAEQTHYLEPVILEAEERAYQEVLEADGDEQKKKAMVRYGLEFLTINERFVIEKFFWDGRSEPKIARMMKKSRSSIQTWKKRGLTKIYELLSSVLPISGGLPPFQTTTHEPKPRRRGRPRKKLRLSAVPSIRVFSSPQGDSNH